MKEGTAVILWTIIVLTIIIVGFIWVSEVGKKESIKKCTKLCTAKSMDFFDTGFYTDGEWSRNEHYICKCLDSDGSIQEFER